MSGNQGDHQGGARVEYEGGMRVSYPAPLRGPTPEELKEIEKRHREGNTEPFRTSADLGWTSLLPGPFGPGVLHPLKGVTIGPAAQSPVEEMQDPRGALASALNEREIFNSRRRQLLADVAIAHGEATETQQRLDGLGEADRRAWASWADGTRDHQKPFPSAPLHAEFTALADSAQRKHEVAQAAFADFQTTYNAAVRRINDSIKVCVEAIIFEEATRLRHEMAGLMIETEKANAQIQGLCQYLSKHGSQQVLTALRQPLHSNDERKSMRSELNVIITTSERFPDALLADPDTQLEPI